MRRFLVSHGAVAAAGLWSVALGTAVALRNIWIPVDQFVGGPPRDLRGSDAVMLVLAALLPTVLRPRLGSWERINPQPTTRILTALLALATALAAPTIAAVQSLGEGADAEGRSAVLNAAAMAALALIVGSLAGPAAVTPLCLALHAAAVAVQQHAPATRDLLSVVAGTAAHPASLIATSTLVAISSVWAATTLGATHWSTGRDRNRA